MSSLFFLFKKKIFIAQFHRDNSSSIETGGGGGGIHLDNMKWINLAVRVYSMFFLYAPSNYINTNPFKVLLINHGGSQPLIQLQYQLEISSLVVNHHSHHAQSLTGWSSQDCSFVQMIGQPAL